MIKDWQVRIIQLLAVPGMLLAYYLLLFHNGDLVLNCGASGWDNCGAVSGPDAPYSSVAGIPVALIGLLGYAVIFGVVWLQDWVTAVKDNLPELLIALTGLAFLFTLWLTGLEIFVIHAVCRYCLISAGIITAMLGLAIHYLRSFK